MDAQLNIDINIFHLKCIILVETFFNQARRTFFLEELNNSECRIILNLAHSLDENSDHNQYKASDFNILLSLTENQCEPAEREGDGRPSPVYLHLIRPERKQVAPHAHVVVIQHVVKYFNDCCFNLFFHLFVINVWLLFHIMVARTKEYE